MSAWTEETRARLEWLADKGDPETGAVNQISFGAQGWREQMRPAIRAALAEVKRQNEIIEGLCSEEPCPRCGYGVTTDCYGCRIKAVIAQRDELTLQLLAENERHAATTGRVRALEAALSRAINASRQYAQASYEQPRYAFHMATLNECQEVLRGGGK